MYLRKILLISATILLCLNSFAQYEKLDDVSKWVQKINGQTRHITSLQANFIQEKNISFLEESVVSKGEFWFQQPNKIRWEYQDPYQYTMIMNDGLLSVIDDGDEYTTDLSSNKMFEQMNSLISASISGDLLNQDAAYDRQFFQDEKHIIIRFIPKSTSLSDYLQYIEIWFGKENLQVQKLVMQEASGDDTRIRFSERKINQEMDSDVFH